MKTTINTPFVEAIMTKKMNLKRLLSAGLVAGFLTPIAQAATIVDFDPTGEYAAEFSGSAYTESATGGLNSSIGVDLGTQTGVSSFDGTQSESIAAGSFQNGASFTVGGFFNMSALPTATSGDTSNVIRLGLTNGGADNFVTMPFVSIAMKNTGTGEAGFSVRTKSTVESFTLSTGQWYYFETTMTRAGTNQVITYDALLHNADAAGVIGTVIATTSDTDDFGISGPGELNKAVYGAFRASGQNSDGVLDNFYVSATGESLASQNIIPEPTSLLVGAIGLAGLGLRRRRRA